MEIDKQHALIRELELPVACLVHSGKKSLHAIVKVDAADYGEYRKRVDYLYDICRKNGLEIDHQNRNPSRLSRMPGVLRGENKQFLIDTNIGKESWLNGRNGSSQSMMTCRIRKPGRCMGQPAGTGPVSDRRGAAPGT